jgi:regulator of cell morphogenesis and NO signaling
MEINSASQVKDIVARFPTAMAVFEARGIDYCCGGEKSLEEACASARVPVEEILQWVKDGVAQGGSAEPSKDWSEAPLSELIEHIVNQHHAYCRKEEQRLAALLAKVVQVHSSKHPELVQMQSVFAKMTQDLAMHLQKEENTLFPLILEMDRAAARGESLPRPAFGTIENPVSMMILEHDQTGTQLKELHRLSHGYRPPNDACASTLGLFEGLRAFEQDMHQHIYLENYVLFPRTVTLEKHFDRLRKERMQVSNR